MKSLLNTEKAREMGGVGVEGVGVEGGGVEGGGESQA